MTILCCGSRTWYNIKLIQETLIKYPNDSLVIHGNAAGADQLSGAVAKQLGMKVKVYPANWKEYGRVAGFLRSIQMLDKEEPNLVIAFWDGRSKGTAHTIKEADNRVIDTLIIRT
jgi:hypothetical protein